MKSISELLLNTRRRELQIALNVDTPKGFEVLVNCTQATKEKFKVFSTEICLN